MNQYIPVISSSDRIKAPPTPPPKPEFPSQRSSVRVFRKRINSHHK